MQRDDRYRKIIHENEYVLKMQNEFYRIWNVG